MSIVKTVMNIAQRSAVGFLACGTIYSLYCSASIINGIRTKRVAWEAENPDFKDSEEYKAVLAKEEADKLAKKKK